MPTAPLIRILKIEHGPFPEARSLNPRFSPDRPLLLARLDILWLTEDPVAAIASVEETLLAFSPGFAKHECRGARSYHVFARAVRRAPAPAASPQSDGAANPFEAALALAHLIEHAVLDFQCAITGERRCSGVTAARRSPPGRFDLLVECRDPEVGRCCLVLSVAWLTSITQGHTLGATERAILAAARLAHDRRGQGLRPPAVARALSWSEDQAWRALSALSEVGYLVETPYSMNLSGVPEYRLSRGRS